MLNFIDNAKDLILVPIGGSGMIGMNFNLYFYKGKWIIVDCGAGFADDLLPGIDIIVADIKFIMKHCDSISAIVLTHAHEDHCGSVIHLYPELAKKFNVDGYEIPIYATQFTAEFLKHKLNDDSLPIVVIDPDHDLWIDDTFHLSFVRLTHSIPEMISIVIKVDDGVVYHTGDWKFDDAPVVGKPTDLKKLEQIAHENDVLAVVGDSTNVMNDVHSGSEGDLFPSFYDIISNATGAVFVSLFASNVARICTIARAANESGREVVVVGRSLWRIISVALKSGYLNKFRFLTDVDAVGFERKKLVVLCTGCQGEPYAASNKLVGGVAFGPIKLLPNDTFVFSSKVIPGNEKRIYRIFNKITKMKVNLMTENSHNVHVSGHPSKEEVIKMYTILKPKAIVPVHGEDLHISEHIKVAQGVGINSFLDTGDGDVIKISKDGVSKIGSIDTGMLCIDGKFFRKPDGDVISSRIVLRDHGAFILSIILGGKGQLLHRPWMYAPGVIDKTSDKWLRDDMIAEIKNTIHRFEAQGDKVLGKKLRSYVYNKLKNDTQKYPLIKIKIQRLPWIS